MVFVKHHVEEMENDRSVLNGVGTFRLVILLNAF